MKRIQYYTFRITTLLTLLFVSVSASMAKDYTTWWPKALKSFEAGDYATCQKLFHQNVGGTPGNYITKNNVSIIPWFESAIALGDWEDAVAAFTKYPPLPGAFYNNRIIKGVNYILTAEGLRTWATENAPLHSLLWEVMVRFYWDKTELFNKSPFVKHLGQLGIATLEQERAILGKALYTDAINTCNNINGDPLSSDVLTLLETASELGYDKAILTLGNIYEKGATLGPAYAPKQIDKDYVKAFGYWKQAAENNGLSWGWHKLGACYQSGIGAQKDLSKAIECFKKSYDTNNSGEGIRGASASALAEIYRDRKEYDDFFNWAQKSYNESYPFASVHLAQAYKLGRGCDVNPTKAFEFAEKCYKINDKSIHNIGCINLSDCYFDGIGCEKDVQKSINFLREAADTGDSLSDVATYCAAVKAYTVGMYDTALEYFRKIEASPAEYGNSIVANTYLTLGKMYRFGRGVAKDELKADEYTHKAAGIPNDNDEKFTEALRAIGILSPALPD